jgi:hypothetical protein
LHSRRVIIIPCTVVGGCANRFCRAGAEEQRIVCETAIID